MAVGVVEGTRRRSWRLSSAAGPRMTRRWGLTLVAGGVLAIAGCGNDDGAEPTPEVADPTPDPTASPVPSAALSDVIWSTGLSESGEPDSAVTTFWREESVIHAAVEATNLEAGEELTAIWTINGAQIEGTVSTVEIEEAIDVGWVSFALTWEGVGLWPVGTLGITITASNGTTTSSSISIVSTK